MQEEVVNILIIKHLQGKCSPQEQARLDAWRSESAANQEHYKQIALLENQLAKMDVRLDANTADGWSDLQGRIARQTGASIPVAVRPMRWLRVAAAAVAVMAIAWVASQYWPGQSAQARIAQQYEVPFGQKQQIELPDGSSVALNAGSMLEVYDDFNKQERRVRLKGKGFFQIAKDAERPFIIESGALRTEVLGTAFLLSAYPNDREMRLDVTEGKVRFSTLSGDALTLTAGQGALYDRQNQQLSPASARPDAAIAWQQLAFDNTPFSDALHALERRFDVHITDRAGLADERLSTRFGSKASLPEVLEQLALLYQLEWQQQGREVVLEKK